MASETPPTTAKSTSSSNPKSQDPNDAVTRIAPVVATVCFALALIVYMLHRSFIPTHDVVFSVAFSLYLFAINWIRFDNNSLAIQQGIPHGSLGKSQFLGTPGFERYGAFAAITSALLPLLLVVVAAAMTTTTNNNTSWTLVAQHAAPHLMVCFVQIGMEQATNTLSFHDLPRILVPLGFSVWREWTLWTWAEQAYGLYNTDRILSLEMGSSSSHSSSSSFILLFGFVLALTNLVFYSYNLFVFLLLRMTPYYLNPNESPVPQTKWVAYLWPVIERPVRMDSFFVLATNDKGSDDKTTKKKQT